MTRRTLLRTIAGAAASAGFGRAEDYKGRTMAVVTAHADDFTIFAGGTIARMIREGYTADLIRITNDEKDSTDLSLAETILRNRQELRKAADIIGIRDIYSLDFRNDEMDPVSEVEVREKLILLFRKLKPWSLFTFDPSAKYEENPDHKKTARAAEDAAWNSAGHLAEPLQLLTGVERWAVLDRYYWARTLDLPDANKAVDISSTIDQKIRAIQQHRTMMFHTAHQLKEKLAEAKLRLPILETINDETVNKLIDIRIRERAEYHGSRHGLKYAEEFHYVPIEGGYVMQNAVPL